MITATLDASDAIAMLDRVEAAVEQTPAVLGEEAEAMAQELRATDPYQNRTWKLRSTTVSSPEPDGATVEMQQEYASFVQSKGYSNFDEVGERTKTRATERVERNLDSAAR